MTTKRTPPPTSIVTRSRTISVTSSPNVDNAGSSKCPFDYKKRKLSEHENIAQEADQIKYLENKIDELKKMCQNTNNLCISLTESFKDLMADHKLLKNDMILIKDQNSQLLNELHSIKNNEYTVDKACSNNYEAIQKSNETVISCVENLKSSLTKVMSENSADAASSLSSSSFANVLKSNYPVVIVKPKDQCQKNESTRSDIRKAIDPKTVPIKNIRNTKNGGIAIECATRDATNALRLNASSLLGDSYNITIPEKRHPKIKVMGLTEITDDLAETILQQNDHIFDTSSKIKIVHTFQSKNTQLFGFKMEMDVVSYGRIMLEPKLRIGWDICRVYEELDVNRCYNCSQFNHLAKDCRSKIACPKCSGSHLVAQCKSTVEECPNCKKACEKLRIRLDKSHTAWDSSCPVYQRKLSLAKNRVDYGSRLSDTPV